MPFSHFIGTPLVRNVKLDAHLELDLLLTKYTYASFGAAETRFSREEILSRLVFYYYIRYQPPT
jgi:hypothetical protein